MSTDKKIRKPAVAGQFYPLSPKELREDVENYLAKETHSSPTVNMIIAPHAGYIFSAPVAAKAYTRINKNAKTVFLIGPSHHKWFDGVHITDTDGYETPLGTVNVNKDIINKLNEYPFCHRALGVEEKEHCLEVHLPFLQVMMESDFTIVPILTGKANVSSVADMLLPFLDDTAIIIASSDLSHYHSQKQAREMDDMTVSTIITGNPDGFMDGCGETAMRVVMEIAAKKGLSAELLDARTSYETVPQYGDPSRVVGYAAVAFVNKNEFQKESDDFTSAEKKYLLALARKTLELAVNGKDTESLKTSKPDISRLSQYYGCFVTLNTNGHLRGCIGNIEPVKPLYKSVIDNAVNAAFRDPRFPKVGRAELDSITIEVSILTIPQLLDFKSPDDLLSKLVPFEHGVILKKGSRQSTFLPQVWEQIPEKTMFLEHLAMKAGMGVGDWKNAEVWVYKAVHFSEMR